MLSANVKITGISPLLMHSDRGANPLNKDVIIHKQLTSKRKKTDEDQVEIAKSEWFLSLYLDGDNKIVVPSNVIFSTLVNGAKKNKLGTQVKTGVQILGEQIPLIFPDKSKAIDKLWDLGYYDCRSVVVNRSRIMRYRPKFSEWSLEFPLVYDETVVTLNDIQMSFFNAGRYVGLCDFAPRNGGQFGRFSTDVS